MSRDINPYALRLPTPLKDALKELAHDARRSLNAEIVTRLINSLAQDGVAWNGAKVNELPKIYDVQPGQLKKGKLNQNFTKKGVDYLTLTVAIETGEQQIESENKEYNARKKALLFSLLYDSIDDEDPDARVIDQKTMKMLMELAG